MVEGPKVLAIEFVNAWDECEYGPIPRVSRPPPPHQRKPFP